MDDKYYLKSEYRESIEKTDNSVEYERELKVSGEDNLKISAEWIRSRVMP